MVAIEFHVARVHYFNALWEIFLWLLWSFPVARVHVAMHYGSFSWLLWSSMVARFHCWQFVVMHDGRFSYGCYGVPWLLGCIVAMHYGRFSYGCYIEFPGC